MKSKYLGLATLVLFAGSVARAEDKPVENKLAALERFVGEWVVDGQWTGGEALHARGVYEWGLGKKILRARTYVKNGEQEYQRYEGVMAWHPDKKSLYEISFAYDGAINEVLIESKDRDTLRIGYRPFHADKPQPVRQTLTFVDDDHFRWVVELQQGAEWKQLIDATWRRVKK
jgi:hypothetical protein